MQSAGAAPVGRYPDLLADLIELSVHLADGTWSTARHGEAVIADRTLQEQKERCG